MGGDRGGLQVSSAVAKAPVVPGQQGLIVGGVVFGTISLAVVLLFGHRSRGDVGLICFTTVFFAVFWGGLMGWWLRRRQPAMYGGLAHAAPPAAIDPQRTLVGGVVRTGVMTVLLAAFYTVYIRVISGADELSGLIGFLPGGLFGLSIATAIGLRGLRRWQEEHHLDVFTRRGARRIAWTHRQSGDQLVAVPRNP